MNDLLVPAYQKLYAALQSLERFSKGQDLFENIACIDSFLSEFRNGTFVLQKSLAHTEYKSLYEVLRDKYLENDDCSWLKEKRNEVLKKRPFSLEKKLILTLYHPNGAGVFSTDSFSIEDEQDYTSLIEMVKRIIENVHAIEVFFSVEFVYKEIGSDRNIFSCIDNGIDAIWTLLEELNKAMAGEMSQTREAVLEKINGLHFHTAPKDFWFVDDYVFYRKDHVFEKGERFEILHPKVSGQYTALCEMAGIKNNGHFIEETFEAFVKIHICIFSKQKKIAPTLLTLNEDGTLSMVMYDASLKTTTYRKIHEIAEEIGNGEPIVAVFHVCEMLCYDNTDLFNQDYSYRIKNEHTELLWFSNVTKGGCQDYCISSEAIIDGDKDCLYPTLTKAETDGSRSYMKPLVNALKE